MIVHHVAPQNRWSDQATQWSYGTIVKARLEVSQLITNDYYLGRKGMLSVNR